MTTEQDPPSQAVKEFQQILSDGERWKDRALIAEQKLQQAEAALKLHDAKQAREKAAEFADVLRDEMAEDILSRISKAGFDVTDCDGDEGPAFVIADWVIGRMRDFSEAQNKAEAAVAEMRDACDMALSAIEHDWDHPFNTTKKLKHALSTSCGQGWLSPEAVEAKLSNYKITDAARQETIAALREKVHTLTGALETAQSKLDRYAIEHPAICYQCGAEVKKP